MLVGLGAPFVTAMVARRREYRAAEHELADRILDLWKADKPLIDLLRDDRLNARRSLLLLGVRLSDQPAREACLRLVHVSGTPGATEDELLDLWGAVVEVVSGVYRRT